MDSNKDLKIEDFKFLIKKLANDKYLKLFLSQEDIEQELSEKIIKNFDKIRNCSGGREGAFSFTKVMLLNELKSKKKFFFIRNQHSKNALIYNDDENLSKDGLIQEQVSLLAGELLPKTESAIDITLYNQLKKIILKWLESQDEPTRKFIMESINPSDEILEKYEEMIKTYGKTPHQIYIPPKNRAQLLGISEKKKWKILADLEKFLNKHGFKI